MSSQLELFKATMAHEQHGAFLYKADFIKDLEERLRKHVGIPDNIGTGEYFGMFEPVHVGLKAPADLKPVDFSGYFKDIEIPECAYINGIGVLEIPGSAYHFTRFLSPLRNCTTVKEIESFAYPNVDGYSDAHIKAIVDDAHKNGRVTCTNIVHMYEEAWQIRGYTEFLMDMMDNPEVCEFILDKIMHRNILKAEAAARAGVDYLITGDDVANQRDMMFSLDVWRHFIKSRWAKVYAAARAIKPDIQIWYHSCGMIEKIIPELIEIGVTILNPIQTECMDPVELKRKFGKQLVFDGSIGTQTTMPFGTPDEVKRVVAERKKTLGYDGALIISPTHVLEPEVPIENILAFVEACREN